MEKKIDFFNINDKAKSEETLEERFSQERQEWNEKITSVSSKLKNVFDIPELMTTLYTERQLAVDYYHYLISLMIGINKKYKAAYDERWNYYTHGAQIRYPNESTKHNRILVDLADLVEKRSAIENHMKFIDRSIGTLDNIIFAVPKRVEIENIARGK